MSHSAQQEKEAEKAGDVPGREEFVRENALALLADRDARIKQQRVQLAKQNNALCQMRLKLKQLRRRR